MSDSADEYRVLFENNPQPMWVYDPETLSILAVNEAAMRLYGYSRDEFLSMTIEGFHTPGDALRLVELVKSGTDSYRNNLEWRHRRKDGTLIDVLVSAHSIRYGGRPARLVTGVDVTEWRRAERERDQFFNLSADLFCISDLDGHFKRLNPAWEAALGYSLDELMARPFMELVHPEDQERTAAELKKVAGGEVTVAFENRYRRKDGSYVWLLWSSRPVVAEGLVFAVAHDITGRRADEQALREAKEEAERERRRVISILESLTDAFFTFDREFRFTYLNAQSERLLRRSREELLGRFVWDEFPEAVGSISYHEYNRALQEGVPVLFETYYPPLESWLEVRAYPSPNGLAAYVSNISDRKRAEEALRAGEERFRAVVNSVNDLVFILDRDLRHTGVYGLWLEQNHFSADNFLGKTVRDLFGPEEARMHEAFCARALEGKSVMYEWSRELRDGRHWFQTSLSPLRDGGGNVVGVVGVGRDYTGPRQLEEQLRQAQKMEAVGQLAGGVAHDFNNLLTAINGYCELALRRLQPGDPLHGYLSEVRKAGERGASLTGQLLAFSRKQVMRARVVDLNEVVRDIQELLARVIGEDIELRTEYSAEASPVEVDPGQVSQVLMNLAVNARDAMPHGGRLTVKIAGAELDEAYSARHEGVRPGHYVMLEVSDTGVGMDAQTRQRIFEPFFTTKGPGKGTGLGLATVYGIVKQLGGSIWTYSEPGEGTIFKIYFPQATEPRDAAAPSRAEHSPAQGTETILVAEDDPAVRNLVCDALEQCGYRVHTAADGFEAVQACEQPGMRIDLLLTDVVMPKMRGRELAERVSALFPAVKVLYMSGYAEDFIVPAGVPGEELEFIAKPFTTDALVARVRELLDRE